MKEAAFLACFCVCLIAVKLLGSAMSVWLVMCLYCYAMIKFWSDK